MVSAYTMEFVRLLAGRSPHKEICGLVDSEGDVYPILNVSLVPSDFVFSKSMYGRTLKKIKELGRTIKCVYHSHLDGDPTPSSNDLNSMEICKLDYLIVAKDSYTYTRFK